MDWKSFFMLGTCTAVHKIELQFIIMYSCCWILSGDVSLTANHCVLLIKHLGHFIQTPIIIIIIIIIMGELIEKKNKSGFK